MEAEEHNSEVVMSSAPCYSFDLTPFAGETVMLRLGVVNDGLGGQTVLYVDSASLITLGPAGRRVYLSVILKREAYSCLAAAYAG